MKRLLPARIYPAIIVSLTTLWLAFGSNCLGQPIDLDFSNPVGTADGSYTLGPYFSGSIIYFTDVADVNGTAVDMRATAGIFGSGYTFQGHFANYNQAIAEPNGDLGNRYVANSLGAGGLTYTLDFFLGGSNFTTHYELSEFELFLYDVDGESGSGVSQTEAFRAYTADGLTAYRLSSSPNSVTASEFSGGVLFNGPGVNVAETDASGAVLLTYQNTSSVTFRFEGNTISGSVPNGIFTAIDGDKSLIGGSYSQFEAPVVVPEPSSALLLGLAVMQAFFTRQRRSMARR
ncbi:MAG: PEP-CTERM sorting domain-containing protein [Prosthecobacter sp.]